MTTPEPGTPGCGKTLLLKSLAANGTPGSVKKHSASVPTTGQSSVSANNNQEARKESVLQGPTLSMYRKPREQINHPMLSPSERSEVRLESDFTE